MKRFITFLFLATSCSQTTTNNGFEVWTNPKSPSVHTLRLQTNRDYSSVSDTKFRDMSQRLCPSGYDILETTVTPTTLQEDRYDTNIYNWVIDCPLDTKFDDKEK